MAFGFICVVNTMAHPRCSPGYCCMGHIGAAYWMARHHPLCGFIVRHVAFPGGAPVCYSTTWHKSNFLSASKLKYRTSCKCFQSESHRMYSWHWWVWHIHLYFSMVYAIINLIMSASPNLKGRDWNHTGCPEGCPFWHLGLGHHHQTMVRESAHPR